MASRFSRLTRSLFGRTPSSLTSYALRGAVGKHFVQLEDRSVPATFVVTNILDNQADIVGGLSLRQAIFAANGNPGFDNIVFNIPRSPSLPTIPGDPTENYFPIVLASSLPDLTDPSGVSIDATTQPRNNPTGTRPIVQLLPDPNPGAFPGQKGAFFISGANNVIRGLVITGFPGSAINITGPNAHDNILLGNWVNTDISGTRPWSEDPFIASARPPGTPPELTNTGPLPSKNPLFVLAGLTITDGATHNIIGGVIDENAIPLADFGGNLVGTGGFLKRFDKAGNLVTTSLAITPEVNRNIISGTPQFKKSYFQYDVGKGPTDRKDDVQGSGVGPGIRIMDPGTDRNLIQGNFIGTDVTGNRPIPNHNGIEIFNTARSNMIGNPTTEFIGDPVAAGIGNLIRFNENDGVRLADHPNPSQYTGADYAPFLEGEDFFTVTTPGPFGPINAAGTLGTGFFDSLNPAYFHGRSPTSPNIFTVDRTTFDFTNKNTILNPAKATPAPGISVQVGATITLRGTGLLSTSSVTFNASTASTPNPQTVPAKFVVVSDGEIRVTVPAGAATPPPIVAPNPDIPAINVFSPAGLAKLMDAVILPSPPAQIEVVSTFAPSSGEVGSVVSVFGTNFSGVQTVSIGGVLASNFTVQPGGTQIDIVVPTGAVSGPISIVTPGGAASTTRDFRVETQPPPVVTAIDRATALPGEEVVLTGANFLGAYLLRFNWTGGASGFSTTNFTVESPTQIRARVPVLASASTGVIQVVTNDGFGASAVTLQILPPPQVAVTSLSPNNGPIGTTVNIVGSKFTSTTRVTFSGIDSAKFTIVSDNVIQAVVPFGLPVNVASVVRIFTVNNGGFQAGTFTPAPSLAPTIQAIPFGIRNNFVVVNGTNLLGTTKVLFGNAITGTPAPSFEVLSNTQIRIQIPPAVASNGNYFLYTAFNTQNPLQPPAQNTFAVANSVAPTINVGRQTDPISGTIGQTVSLRGSGFLGVQNVFFQHQLGGLVPANNLTVITDGEITFTVPLFAVSGQVIVDTLGVPDTGTPFDPLDPIERTSINFTVLASPAPTINNPGFAPAVGPVGTVVRLSGSGFLGAVQLSVGGGPVDNFNIESDNLITFRMPILAQDGPITLVTVGGSVVSTSQFDVIDPEVPSVLYSTPRAARNTRVTISGSGLASTSKVLFNDVPAQFTVISDTVITAIVPLTAAPGEIRVFTAGGTASSPTPFNLQNISPPVLAAVGGRQRDESPDMGPPGTRIEINSSTNPNDAFNINSVFRVEFAPKGGGVDTGASASFQFGGGGIVVTVPELPPGEYEVQVFGASTDAASGNHGGSWFDTSYSEWTNILGRTYEYGETFYVLPNARPVIESIFTNDTLDGKTNVPAERGVPITIRGRGFTGANRILIGGAEIKASQTTPRSITVAPNFKVLSDNAILVNIPIGKLGGIDAIDDALVQVFTPNGTVGDPDDDLVSLQTGPEAQVDIAAFAKLEFDISGLDGGVYGLTGTIKTTSGNFFGVTRITGDAWDQNGPTPGKSTPLGLSKEFPQPFSISGATMNFQNFTISPNTGGTEATVRIPTTFAKIPDYTPPVPPPDPLPPPGPPAADLYVFAKSNGGTVAANGEKVTLFQNPDTSPTIQSIAADVAGDPFARNWTIIGSLSLLEASSLVIDTVGGGTFAINPNNMEVSIIPFTTLVQIQFVMPVATSILDPNMIVDVPSGNVTVNTVNGQTNADFEVSEQPASRIFIFATPDQPVQDNRIVANRVYDNGVTIDRDPTTGFITGVTIKPQDTKFTDGNLGIDFVTADPNNGGFPFIFGFATEAQPGPILTPPPGNEGKGGLNDGSPPGNFVLPPSKSALPTDPIFNALALPSGPLFSTGANTFNNTQYGRYFGPNLLQNFPLLQVVQSTVDRTTFSTALIAKPFKSYRIDYYYNVGTDNGFGDSTLDPFLAGNGGFTTGSRFDDQDITARKTTNIGSGQLYLGSKVITTDDQGNGSVSFEINRRLPTIPGDPNSVPPLQPGDFNLPGNLPLQPSVVDAVTGNVTFRAGVVVATATDLTAAGPDGPILTEGPDGTSRMSFFKRVDTPTGSISGRVIFDENKNGKVDAGESGVADAILNIFVQKSDGSYNVSPSESFTTDDSGAYLFGQFTSGYGLPNGVHRVELTLPTGGPITYFYEIPSDGKLAVPIITGNAQVDQDFLVIDQPGSPPTISDIPNQVTGQGGTVGPLLFFVNDLETPAANLVVTAVSSNPAFTIISIGGSGTNRTITVQSPAGVSDTTTITVTVTDDNGLTASDSFSITAGGAGPNTPPTITPIADQILTPGGTVGPITFTIGDAETAGVNLLLTRISSNGVVIPLSGIVFGGSGNNRTVTITAAPVQIGSSTITVIVTDEGGLSAQTSFVATVPPPPGTAAALLAAGSDAGRVAQVNVYNPNGTFRYSLTPYGTGYTGGVRVATGDVTGDGNADIITAPGVGISGLVKIYDGVSGQFINQILPYGEFKGGVYVVTGDVDGDGILDIITGTGKGGGPRVRALRGGITGGVMNLESLQDFFPYEPNFRGGVLVASGDINGDGKADFLTGTGVTGGPRVRILDGQSLTTLYDFFAYGANFRGGVFVSAGDFDPAAPGLEIATGTGFGGGPVVKIFRQSDLAGNVAEPVASKSFFAYDPAFRGGVRIDALDGNNDGIVDIVTAPGAGIPPEVRVINYATLQDLYRITAFESTFLGGVFVGGNLPL